MANNTEILKIIIITIMSQMQKNAKFTVYFFEGFPKQRSPPNGKSEDFDFVFNQIKLEHFLYVVQCCKKKLFYSYYKELLT